MPDGWAWARLENIGDIITGGTPNKSHPEYYGNAFPFFKPTDLEQGRITINSSEYLSLEGKSCCRIIPKYSTAVCCIGSIGKCGYLNVEGTTNQQINSIIPNIDSLYVYYYCSSNFFLEKLLSLASATTIAIVNKSKMGSVLIPVPPIVEQKRIAAILDTALKLIEIIEVEKSNIIVATNNAKSKILDLAIRGKLVPQDPNDEPASVLLERIRAEKEELIKQGKIKRDKKESIIFKGDDNSYYQDLPKNWVKVNLLNVSEMITKGTTPRGGKVAYVNKGVGFLRAENIAGYDKLDLSNLNYVDEYSHNNFLKRSILKANDILITIAGTLGRTAIVSNDVSPLNTNQAVAIVRLVNCELLNEKYIVYAINAPTIKKDLLMQSVDMAIPNLSLENISNCVVNLPPLAEQKRIVVAIETLFAQIDKIAKQIS